MTSDPGSVDWRQSSAQTLAELPGLVRRLVDELRPLGFCDKELFGIRLALEEALVNAIKHGHREDPAKTVRIRYQANNLQFMIEIQDEGCGFDPDGLPNPLAPENLERPGGRGVFLMRHFMSWVHYNEAGTCVTLCKLRRA